MSIDVSVPSFWNEPVVRQLLDKLSGVSLGLMKGNYMNPQDPELGFLNQLVSLNPQATRAAIGLEARDLNDTYRSNFQDITNTLAANNQLSSSVTGNSLGRLAETYSKNIEDMASKYYISDVERSMGNIGKLFELGLGTGAQTTSLGLQNQQQNNTFSLSAFNAELQKEMANQLLNQDQSGGWAGGLMGALGGGLTGFTYGGPWGAALGAGLGGATGYFAPSGTGGQMLSAGALMSGLNGLKGVIPGSMAANSSLGTTGFEVGSLKNSPLLSGLLAGGY